jgi:PPM family protein phosphatase
VGANISPEEIIWFNVGDSRAYLFRDNVLKQLSVDHIPTGDTGLQGQRRTHAITQSLGGTHRPVDIWPAVGTLIRKKEDWLLLCSDGLSDLVTNAEMQAWLRGAKLDTAAQGLVALALERGAPDNVTVIVAAL